MRTRFLALMVLPLLGGAASPARAGFDDRLAWADSLLQRHEVDAAASVLDSLETEAASGALRAEELKVLLAQARLNGLVGRSRQGRSSATRALTLAAALNDTLATCRALRWLAVAAQLEGAMSEAHAHAQRLLDVARPRQDRFHEGQGYLLLAYSDQVTGNLAASEAEYTQAVPAFVEAGNLMFELMARQGLGWILADRGEVDSARQCLLQVLEGSRKIGDPFGEARALNDLGVLEFIYRDPSAATDYYAQAFTLQISNRDLAGSVTTATNLALVHTYLGEFEEALAVLNDAWDRSVAAGQRIAEAAVLERIATVRRAQGRYGEAAELFRKSAALVSDTAPEQVTRALTGLAHVLGLRDSTAAAITILAEGYDPIRHRVSPSVCYEAERAYAEMLFSAGRLDEALERFRQAEQLARRHGFGFLVGNLTYESRCHASLGSADSARVYLDRAIETWESQRARIQDPDWREQLEIDGRMLYTEVARQTLGDSAGAARIATAVTASAPAAARARTAFNALQRFKARTLRERMRGAFTPRPDSTNTPASLLEELRTTVTVDELQAGLLAEDEVLLDFFLGTDAIYLFGVTQSDCRAATIPCEQKALEQTLRRYRELVGTRPGHGSGEDGGDGDGGTQANRLADAAGERLSSLVLTPMADLLETHRHVILALDGYLNLTPVELWPAPSAANAPATGEPLLSHWRVMRVPSATMLRDHRARMLVPRNAPETTARMAAVIEGDEIDSPPGVQAETAWLRRSFRQVRVLQASGTDHEELAAELARYDIIHISAHVRVDDVHPWRSGLFTLRAQQVAEMSLPARLAVLAGCESAGGRVVSGEGVLGLTSAFESAGVPAVVTTLWPVSDRTTADLMRVFYGALATGQAAGEALRTAQRAIRDDRRTRHPFYWAGFVLVGEDGIGIPLQRKRPVSGTVAILLVLGVGAGCWRFAWSARRGRIP